MLRCWGGASCALVILWRVFLQVVVRFVSRGSAEATSGHVSTSSGNMSILEALEALCTSTVSHKWLTIMELILLDQSSVDQAISLRRLSDVDQKWRISLHKF
jgi:hypothetical protein